MAMSRSLLECGHDEVRDDDDGVTDICSYCATEGKLQPALHFCFDCGVYGRYICGICLKHHGRYVNNHEVERIDNQSKSKRKKESDSKVNELQQSNAELQKDKNKLQKEKDDLLVDIHDVRKENEKQAKTLSDCIEALDVANNKLKTKTEEFERETKEKDCRLKDVVKERDDLLSRSKSLAIANENLQRKNKSLEAEKTEFLTTLNDLKKENTTMPEKLNKKKMENTDHTSTKEAHQQEFGRELRVKDYSKLSVGMRASGVKLIKKEKLLVVAIEIGNSSSCYAFSFGGNPLEVSCSSKWNAMTFNRISLKAPTAILFDANKKFQAFGFEAEEGYAELVEDGKHHEWYFFRRFMSTLQEENIAKKNMLVDDKGKEMKVIDVLSAVITYLKGHVFSLLETECTEILIRDIHWVIPVPAMWTDTAIQIMREAAYQSGIIDANLTLVSEPEAAASYFQTIPASYFQTIPGDSAKSTTQSISSPGTKFMIIVLGDSSASFTVFVRQSDGDLLEVKAATDVACGTNMVEGEFHRLMRDIVGDEVYQRWIDKNQYDFFELQLELKSKILSVKPGVSGKMTLQFPVSLPEKMKAIDKSQYRGKLTSACDKLRIDADVFNNLFKPCIDKVVGYIQDLLKDQYIQGTEIFLMAGEFSGCLMVQEAIMRAFPNINVIIPKEPRMTMLKGAVIYGHQH